MNSIVHAENTRDRIKYLGTNYGPSDSMIRDTNAKSRGSSPNSGN